MARRKSHIAKRVQKMRGLDAGEKSVLLRIGELIDGLINNRSPSNPSGDGRIRTDPQLPPPKIITHEPGIRSAKLSWEAVDSSILSHYEVAVTSADTGTTETFTSYTNTFFFKGREGGDYSATVRSVGRNGTKSPILANIDFFVAEDVMLIEGSKNNFNTLGTEISEDIFHTSGHKIFIWPAFTIDKLIGSSTTGNSVVSARLYRGLPGSTINQATFIEEVSLYRATETATNLDNTALGGISRPQLEFPVAGTLDSVRSETFETAYSFMFSPISVDPDDETLVGKTFVYFVQIIGRETEADITGLSITIWSGNEGTAAQAPSDPFVAEPGIVTDDRKAVEMHAGFDASDPATQWMHSNQLTAGFNFIQEVWTITLWIKFLRLGTRATIFEIFEPDGSTGSTQMNNILFQVLRNSSPGSNSIITDIQIGGPTGNLGLFRRVNPYTVANPNDPDTNITDNDWNTSPPGGNIVFRTNLLNHWHYISITMDPFNGITLHNGFQFINGTDTTPGISQDSTGPRSIVIGSNGSPLYTTTLGSPIPSGQFQGPDREGGTPFVGRIHSMGWWNKVLSPEERLALYNAGDGAEIHWLNNQILPLNYFSSSSLVHYWQFGALSDTRALVGRDTGHNPLESGGLDGDMDVTEDGEVATDFSVAQNVVDDFPEL